MYYVCLIKSWLLWKDSLFALKINHFQIFLKIFFRLNYFYFFFLELFFFLAFSQTILISVFVCAFYILIYFCAPLFTFFKKRFEFRFIRSTILCLFFNVLSVIECYLVFLFFSLTYALSNYIFMFFSHPIMY